MLYQAQIFSFGAFSAMLSAESQVMLKLTQVSIFAIFVLKFKP
jgi:hypothetical protein